MNLFDFKRLVAPIKRKIMLSLGKALLKAIDNTEGTQKVQVVALNNETISEIERFQEYGFETYPFADSEVALIFLNGNRTLGIALCVHDRRYRPDDLVEGEVCSYTDEDQLAGGHRYHFKRGQLIEEKGKNKTETIVEKKKIDCEDHEINASEKHTVNATTGVELDGGLGNKTGCVCGRSICHFTGLVHGDVSEDVKVSKA